MIQMEVGLSNSATQQKSVNVGFPYVKRHLPQAGKPVQDYGFPNLPDLMFLA